MAITMTKKSPASKSATPATVATSTGAVTAPVEPAKAPPVAETTAPTLTVAPAPKPRSTSPLARPEVQAKAKATRDANRARMEAEKEATLASLGLDKKLKKLQAEEEKVLAAIDAKFKAERDAKKAAKDAAWQERKAEYAKREPKPVTSLTTAFGYYTKVPEGMLVELAIINGDATKMAAALALQISGIRLIQGDGSWTAILKHRPSKESVVLVGKGNTVSVSVTEAVRDAIPEGLVDHLGYIDALTK